MADTFPTVPKFPQGPLVDTNTLYRQDDQDGTINSMSNEYQASAPAGVQVAGPQTANYVGDTKGLSTFGVAVYLTLATTIAACVDVYLNGHLTYITGAVFIVVSIFCAIKVCKRDLWTSVITPPIAFLIALLVSGQIEIFRSSGDFVIKQFALVATGLAFNAPYIFGGTVLALIIVLIRRKK